MHVELAKLIIRYLTVLARISPPPVVVGLPAISSELWEHTRAREKRQCNQEKAFR